MDELLDAGVTSFKIEGRLKARAYIVNVVSWYRQKLDRALAVRGWDRSSSGHSSVDFEPDVSKTFNRGYTTYFIDGRAEPPGAVDSPKMVGEGLGRVMAVQGRSFVLKTAASLHSGDGLCWFDEGRELRGTFVNAVQPIQGGAGEVRITPEKMGGIRQGLQIHRNHDHVFVRQAERSRPVRKIALRLRLESMPEALVLHAEDEDGNRASSTLATEQVLAHKPEKAEATTRKQLGKTGNTPFVPAAVDLAWDRPCFVPVAELNALRREALDRLSAVRAANRSLMRPPMRPLMRGGIQRNQVPYPETSLTYRGNALNRQAVAFYQRHGVEEVTPAAESGLDMRGEIVMRTRHCIKHQLGLCDGTPGTSDVQEPLTLLDEDGHRYRLRFDCADCEMEVVY